MIYIILLILISNVFVYYYLNKSKEDFKDDRWLDILKKFKFNMNEIIQFYNYSIKENEDNIRLYIYKKALKKGFGHYYILNTIYTT